MYMLKLLFQILQIRPILAPGKTADLLGPCWRLPPTPSGGIWAIVFQGERDDHPSLGTANCQDKIAAVLSPNSPWISKPLTTPCLFPVIKSLAWKENVRQFFQGVNLPSSQIASPLNKAPIKIQSLSLFVGFGSDRQPENQCLFQFHVDFGGYRFSPLGNLAPRDLLTFNSGARMMPTGPSLALSEWTVHICT